MKGYNQCMLVRQEEPEWLRGTLDKKHEGFFFEFLINHFICLHFK